MYLKKGDPVPPAKYYFSVSVTTIVINAVVCYRNGVYRIIRKGGACRIEQNGVNIKDYRNEDTLIMTLMKILMDHLLISVSEL